MKFYDGVLKDYFQLFLQEFFLTDPSAIPLGFLAEVQPRILLNYLKDFPRNGSRKFFFEVL